VATRFHLLRRLSEICFKYLTTDQDISAWFCIFIFDAVRNVPSSCVFNSRCPSPSVLYGAFYRFPRCLHLSLSPIWTSFHYRITAIRGNLPPPRVPNCFIDFAESSCTFGCKSLKVSQPVQREASSTDSLYQLNPTGIARSIS
jgi:hypothetical protein